LRDVSRLVLDGFRGRAGNPATGTPAIVKQRVKEQGAN